MLEVPAVSREAADRIAAVLRDDLGMRTGERVLLRGPNGPWMAAAWFGAHGLGPPSASATSEIASPSMRSRLLSVSCVKGSRWKRPAGDTRALAASQARPPASSVNAVSAEITFTPRASPGLPSFSSDAHSPTVWPWPIASATTSSRMPPRGHAGTSSAP